MYYILELLPSDSICHFLATDFQYSSRKKRSDLCVFVCLFVQFVLEYILNRKTTYVLHVVYLYICGIYQESKQF